MTRVLALLSKLSAYGLSILSRLVFTFIFLGERDLFFRCEFSTSAIWQVPVVNLLIPAENSQQPSAFSS